MVVEARDPVDPTGRNSTCSHVDLRFRIGDLDRYGLQDGRRRPHSQPPEPFTPIPKSVPNGSYAKGLFGFFEHLRMGDALAFAKQSCGSGLELKLIDSAGSFSERRSQKLHDVRFSGANSHQGTYGSRNVEAKPFATALTEARSPAPCPTATCSFRPALSCALVAGAVADEGTLAKHAETWEWNELRPPVDNH
jgi:hypothetical protein